MVTRELRIDVEKGSSVSACLDLPDNLRRGVTPGVILAHGQNNDLTTPVLAVVAQRLAETGTASVLRFNFPYRERGSDRPDNLSVLCDTFRRAHDVLVDDPLVTPGPVFLGGKSLGARVAAELVSRGPEGEGLLARGLVFLGFPLHAPGRADQPRLEPLRRINVPCLFVVGTRDVFCDLELLRRVTADLAYPPTIHVIEGGDHSFQLPRSSGKTEEQVLEEIAEQVCAFVRHVGGATDMKTIELRPMTGQDYERYLAYAVEAYGETMVRRGDWEKAQADELARKTLQDLLPQGPSTPGHRLLAIHDPALAQRQDSCVGFLWIGFAEEDGQPSAYIYDFVILEPYRRRGYGKAALRALEDLVRSAGAHMIKAHVTNENTVARALYDTIGYTVDQVTLTKLIE